MSTRRSALAVALAAVAVAVQLGVGVECQETAPPGTKVLASVVARHNNAGDCWLAYQAKAYSATLYLLNGFHPGGNEVITPYCGTSMDAPYASNQRHSPLAVNNLLTYMGDITADTTFAPTTPLPTTPKPGMTATLSLTYLATYHSGQSSCWVAVNGQVYDFTKKATAHGGGSDKIYAVCGKDGTAAYTAQTVHTPSRISEQSRIIGALNAVVQLTTADYYGSGTGAPATTKAPVATTKAPTATATTVTATTKAATATTKAATTATTKAPTPTTKATTSSSGDLVPVTLSSSYVSSSHAAASSCWIIIQQNVYDFTQYVNQHGGGPDVITAQCGKDASVPYLTNGVHTLSNLPTKTRMLGAVDATVMVTAAEQRGVTSSGGGGSDGSSSDGGGESKSWVYANPIPFIIICVVGGGLVILLFVHLVTRWWHAKRLAREASLKSNMTNANRV